LAVASLAANVVAAVRPNISVTTAVTSEAVMPGVGLLERLAGAVEDAGSGAYVHVEGEAVAGVGPYRC
jgi:hypothetical protein